MKKQLLVAVALVATLSELSAHIFGEGGLVDNTVNTAVKAPSDIVNGPRYNRTRNGMAMRDNSEDNSRAFENDVV